MNDAWNVELKRAELTSPLRWEQLFGNLAPVAIEIGFGKCGFLLNMAAQHPDMNFVGIESSHKYYRKGITKIQKAGLRNIKIIWGDAFHIFKQYVPDQSLAHIYINFPDPWPKKRHAKRRLVRPEMVALFAPKLNPNGWIEIATDVESYLTQMLEIFQADSQYAMLSYQTSQHPENVRTYRSDYEDMFLIEGKIIHYVKYGTRAHS